MSTKDFDTQFRLQFKDGFGDTGLRRVQGLGCQGQVQVVFDRLVDEFELVKVHNSIVYGMDSLDQLVICCRRPSSPLVAALAHRHPWSLGQRVHAWPPAVCREGYRDCTRVPGSGHNLQINPT
jgi:hypothetical protein